MKNNSQKRNFTNTFISTFIVIVLIAATVAIGFFSSGFRNWTKEEWQNVFNDTFDKENEILQDPDDDGSVTDENGNELDQSAVIPMPASMSFALPLSGSELSVQLEATVLPETAVNKTVDWEVVWQNPDGEWSSGKTVTDYVTVTPQSDGSRIATVTCKNAFSEPIIIKVTSRANSEAYATSKVDYRKRLDNVLVSFSDGDYSFVKGGSVILAELQSEVRNDPYSSKPTPDITEIYDSIGTISGAEIIGHTYYIKASDDFKADFGSAVSTYTLLENFNQVTMLETVTGTTLYSYHAKTDTITGSGGIVIPGKPAGWTLQSETWNSVVASLNRMTGHAFELKVVTETSLGDVETIINLTINKSSLNAVATSIQINDMDIVF